MSNFVQIKIFCILFLENPWASIRMCYPCHNQGPTGLKATGGPRGSAQPLQSIKIDQKLDLELKYTQHGPSRGARISGPVLKCIISATIKGQLVQRPLEALGDLHNHSKASKLTKNRTWSQNTPNIDSQRDQDFWPSLKMCHPCHIQGKTG